MKPFAGMVSVEHLNIRKNGGEVETIAIDVKVNARVKFDVLDDLICAGINEGSAMSALWNADGSPTYPMIEKVSVSREYTGVTVRWASVGMEWLGCSLKKFSASISDEHCAELTFQVSVNNPPAKSTDLLATVLKEDTWLESYQPQLDLLPVSTDIDETVDEHAYDCARLIVRLTRKASISWVQRRLASDHGITLGYNATARLIELMESDGLVGPCGVGGEREVLS